jgi:hypothetical protein
LSCSSRRQPLNPQDELARAERLDQIVIRADLQPDDSVPLVAAGRQHNDRSSTRIGAHAAENVEPRHPRQHQIEDDQVRSPLLPNAQRIRAVRYHPRFETRLDQVGLDDPGHRPVILHHQHARGHVESLERQRAESTARTSRG